MTITPQEHIASGFMQAAAYFDATEESTGIVDSEDLPFSEDAQKLALEICVKFYNQERKLLKKHYESMAIAGHDLYLTIAGHGAGFWDRGHGADGDALTTSAEQFNVHIFVNDNNLTLELE